MHERAENTDPMVRSISSKKQTVPRAPAKRALRQLHAKIVPVVLAEMSTRMPSTRHLIIFTCTRKEIRQWIRILRTSALTIVIAVTLCKAFWFIDSYASSVLTRVKKSGTSRGCRQAPGKTATFQHKISWSLPMSTSPSGKKVRRGTEPEYVVFTRDMQG